MKRVNGIAMALLFALVGLIGCRQPPPVITPQLTITEFAASEGVIQNLTLAPLQSARSQLIQLREGQWLTVTLFANCWWEGSLRIWRVEGDVWGSGSYKGDIRVDQPLPDQYDVTLSYQAKEPGFYAIEVWNKFKDRTMQASVTYTK